jgi:hypothetical protein
MSIIEKDIAEREKYDKRIGPSVFDAIEDDSDVGDLEEYCFPLMSSILELLPQYDPIQILRALKNTNGDSERAIDQLLNSPIYNKNKRRVNTTIICLSDPIIDLQVLEQEQAFIQLSSSRPLIEEINRLVGIQLATSNAVT